MQGGLARSVACALLASAVVVSSSLEARADEKDLVLDVGGTKLEMRLVPKGSFVQGSGPSETSHEKDEEPPHQVTITKDLWFGKTPVTRGQFAKFVSDTRYVTEAEKGQSGGSGWDGKQLTQKKDFSWKNPGFAQGDDHPVVLVTFADATAFVAWASRKTGRRVRLPTEAEWEYAARGGTTTPWYAGPAESDALTAGWFKANAGNGTRPVAQKKPNPFGLFDMSGNVFEWCRDVYVPYHDGVAVDPDSTASGGNENERRVLRGGSWLKDVKRGRSAARYRNTPGSRNADNGFRVVVAPSDEGIAPGVGGTASEFAPTSPLGTGTTPTPLSSSSPTAGVAAKRGLGEADAAANPPEPFSWGLLVASPLAAAAAVVSWMLLRRKRTPRPESAATPSAGPTTRVGDDGFFVRAPGVAAGSRVRYEATVNGTQVSDVVPLEGAEETFVYTGSRPTGVRILEVLPPAAVDYRTAQRPVEAPPAPPRQPPPPPPLPAPAPAPKTAPLQGLRSAPSSPSIAVAPSPPARTPTLHGLSPADETLQAPAIVVAVVDTSSSSSVPVAASSGGDADATTLMPTVDADAAEPFLGTPRAY